MGSMTFGPENELSIYHGVEGSTKQPGSTKQAKCSGEREEALV